MIAVRRDPRIFKKYTYEECDDFATFLEHHADEFLSADGSNVRARRVWIWARKDVAKRCRRVGVENPLTPLPGNNQFNRSYVATATNFEEPLWDQPGHPDTAEKKFAAVETMNHAKPLPTPDQREALWKALESSSSLRSVFDPTLTQTTLSVPHNAPTMIAFPTDFHAGGTVRYDLIRRDMKIIAETNGLYAVAVGDYTDNFKAGSKAGNGLYSSVFADPQLQFAYITDMLNIAKGKWLAICEGNHDAWDYVAAGLRRLPDLSQHLDTVFFGERGGSVICEIGMQRYHIIVKHQHAGSSRINTENNGRRLWDEFPVWENADVIVLGHLHYNDLHKVSRKGQSVTYLRSGTYKTVDEWAESKGFKPEYGVASVILFPDEHKVIPFRGDDFIQAVDFFKQVGLQYD